MHRGPARLLAALLITTLAAAASAAGEKRPIRVEFSADRITVLDRHKDRRQAYLRLRPGETIRVHAEGPQLINIKFHDILAPGRTTGEPLALTVVRDRAFRAVVPLKLKLSPRYELIESVGGLSRRERFQFEVPKGLHSFEFTISANARMGTALKVFRGKKPRPAEQVRLVRIPGQPVTAGQPALLPLQPLPKEAPAPVAAPALEQPAALAAPSAAPVLEPAPALAAPSVPPAKVAPRPAHQPVTVPTAAAPEVAAPLPPGPPPAGEAPPEISSSRPAHVDSVPAGRPTQISGAAAPSTLRQKEPAGRFSLGARGELVIPATQSDLGLSYGVLLVLRYHLPVLDGDLALGLEAGYSPARAEIRGNLGSEAGASGFKGVLQGHSAPVLAGLYYDLPLELPVEIGIEVGYAMAWARLEVEALGESLEVEGTVHGYFAGGGLDLPLGPGRLGVAARWVSTPAGTGEIGGLELGGVHVSLCWRFLF